ncbi:hypothetical protein [Arthrobacter sp. JCM 19049]|uniref:hypothetical protein n=1 Tax=Arthrobacter sp. JCM 19049 TaxID=1460643 RepID=UPI0024372C1A|nr:hypothetical protein [Arthrobacter sp. JCM 19049]
MGAISSMIAGTVVSVGWQLSGLPDSTGIDPMVTGILASTIAMIVGSLASQRSHPVPEHIARALEETARWAPSRPAC